MNATAQNIARPFYGVTSLADALRSDWRGFHLSRKMDGCWQARDFNGSILVGEIMRSGEFYVFDIPFAYGEDIRQRPWIERRAALLGVAATFPADMMVCAEGNGGEFIEAVLRDGGEGVVAKSWDSSYGADWRKVKRVETFDCIVAAKHQTKNSVRLMLAGEDCGWLPCRAAYDQIRVGDVVEIAAFGRHASGKFREARFIRIRTDKMEVKL